MIGGASTMLAISTIVDSNSALASTAPTAITGIVHSTLYSSSASGSNSCVQLAVGVVTFTESSTTAVSAAWGSHLRLAMSSAAGRQSRPLLQVLHVWGTAALCSASTRSTEPGSRALACGLSCLAAQPALQHCQGHKPSLPNCNNNVKREKCQCKRDKWQQH